MNPLISGKKKSLLTIIGNKLDMKDEPSPDLVAKDKQDNMDAMHAGQADAEKAAAKMLITAVSNGNPVAVVKAFKALMDICDSMEDMDEGESELGE